MAQHKQASATSAAPLALDGEPASACQPNASPPATMANIPQTMRLSAFSLNTSHAIRAVSTASRFNKSDAVAALLAINPYISATGPSTPPKNIAPNNQGQSFFASPEALKPPSRTSRVSVNPKPLPRYNSPASNTGGISPASHLANGVLAPNRAAAPRA